MKSCECGAERCTSCIEATRPPTLWLMRQHPWLPGKFFVDVANPSGAEKLAMLRQELGEDASLSDFAQAFVDLFKEQTKKAASQKSVCLELYNEYAGTSYKNASALEPAEHEAFEKVWDPDVRLCWGCAKALPVDAPSAQRYCDDACEHAGLRTSCRNCPPEKQKVSNRNGIWHCETCGGGLSSDLSSLDAKSMPCGGKSELEQSLLRGVGQLSRLHNLMDFEQCSDPDHRPAWLDRQRSAPNPKRQRT